MKTSRAFVIGITMLGLLTALAGCRDVRQQGGAAPSTAPVPNVVGARGSDAKKEIQAAGFKVKWHTDKGIVILSSDWSVEGESPTGKALAGATITLDVTKRPTGNPTPSTTLSPSPSARPTGGPGTALALLATLTVKGKSPLTGYARTADFGTAWLDVNRNGCDTRNDILRRDLTSATGSGCRVLTGVLHDPYTGKVIDFTRGETTSTAVQIDHIVPLANAWQTGAQKLSESTRVDLANDPINLLAVDGPTNEQKGDGDAATWLPPRKSFRCTYIAHQVSVKAAYHLWVTSAEKDEMTRVLDTCPDQPTYASTVSNNVNATSAPVEPAPKPSPPAVTSSGGGDIYYQNCTAVRAAGTAPLYRGQPGYRSALDRDGDGIACE